MHSFLSFTFLLVTLLASRAFALEINVGGTIGNVTAQQFLDINDETLTGACTPQCPTANTTVAACTTDACLCDPATVAAITTCEQCLFNTLIAKNIPMPDPRAGSATALTAYAAACLASVNITVPTSEITLTLPADWDGPFGQHLGLPATVITVIVATALASGCIYVVNTM
ncbi:hypothetical protein IEO21_04437 [Rhodonia placenta]|uniref:Extracellular membrane protein CFEM domain-containing protein n=1 Tax=Rhodonia placenta TaxID=104341 RepID=A0A8H7U383_9APHY|nr:hypothetical protein IEO21_04437 [Postia placenta]